MALCFPNDNLAVSFISGRLCDKEQQPLNYLRFNQKSPQLTLFWRMKEIAPVVVCAFKNAYSS